MNMSKPAFFMKLKTGNENENQSLLFKKNTQNTHIQIISVDIF